jgi:hypothetical protein
LYRVAGSALPVPGNHDFLTRSRFQQVQEYYGGTGQHEGLAGGGLIRSVLDLMVPLAFWIDYAKDYRDVGCEVEN